MEEARAQELARVCARLRGVLRARALLREHGSGRLEEVEPSPADPEVLDEVAQRLRLPDLYVEYLRRHHSDAFGQDFVLGWQGVSLLLVAADGLEDATATYASNEGWPETWVVIGLEYEGCYFIDVESGEVRYLDHGVGLRYQEAGRDLVEFLEQVIAASTVTVGSEAYAAIAAHDWSRLDALLRARGEPEPRELTLLGAAVLYGTMEIVTQLLARGVDVEAVSPATGCTALGVAIGTGQREMILRLLEHGANPEARDDDGETVLQWATRRRDEQVIAAALRSGAMPLPGRWLEEIEAAEARAAEARAQAASRAASSSDGAAGTTPSKPRTELPVELYAVAIGVVIALTIVIVVLLLDWLGMLD